MTIPSAGPTLPSAGISTGSSGRFVPRFRMLFYGTNAMVIRWLCGEKVESCGSNLTTFRLHPMSPLRAKQRARGDNHWTVNRDRLESGVRDVDHQPRRSDNCHIGERAGRVKTAQRRRVVLTRPSRSLQSNIGATQCTRFSRHRVEPKRGSRQVDRAGAVQRKDRGLREEPHQFLWRLGFGPSRIPRLGHECEVVQGAEQTAIPGPAERDL